MPLYRLICTECDLRKSKMLDGPEKIKDIHCASCCGPMARDPVPPGSQVLESIDNGVMAKRVTRFADAVRLHQDHAKQDPRNKPVR